LPEIRAVPEDMDFRMETRAGSTMVGPSVHRVISKDYKKYMDCANIVISSSLPSQKRNHESLCWLNFLLL
jgi:hypothetical protein